MAEQVYTTGEIFHSLLSSTAFCFNNSSITTKFEIFHDFWMNEVERLRSQFDERGEARDGSGGQGFGFLVEEFARRSKNLPFRNTDKGQRMADAILNALHEGDSDAIQLGRSRSNSDLLEVRQVGQLTIIVGMGEVKSSFEAFQKKPGQLRRQEEALKLFSDKISGSYTHPFFKNKKMELSGDLTKLLIVPFGEKEKFRNVPDGWQVIEIEFSHKELVFVAKLVWPFVWPGTAFSKNEANDLWEFISGEFNYFLRPRLDDILGTGLAIPYWELGLFSWVTSKLPVLEEDRKLVVELIGRLYWEVLEYSMQAPVKQTDLNDRERKFCERFSVTTGQNTLLMYLGLARHLKVRVMEELRKAGKVRTIKNMLDVYLLDL